MDAMEHEFLPIPSLLLLGPRRLSSASSSALEIRYPLDSLLKNEYWSRRNDCFRWQVVAEGSGLETMLCVMTGSDVLRSRGSISGLIRP
ncbi:unnamed protein product [Linum tenue]|uniref:Uncharacterized protein n=1 Tax=Linum tenue TaxID=586396 RepID=A0AAV0KDM8_9ROSI|nr:unnamed protein product [Linum tenue]